MYLNNAGMILNLLLMGICFIIIYKHSIISFSLAAALPWSFLWATDSLSSMRRRFWGPAHGWLACFESWSEGVGCLRCGRIISTLRLFTPRTVSDWYDCWFLWTCFLLRSGQENLSTFITTFQDFRGVLAQTGSCYLYYLQLPKVAAAIRSFCQQKHRPTSSYLILWIHLPRSHFLCPWHAPWVCFKPAWCHQRSSCRQP